MNELVELLALCTPYQSGGRTQVPFTQWYGGKRLAFVKEGSYNSQEPIIKLLGILPTGCRHSLKRNCYSNLVFGFNVIYLIIINIQNTSPLNNLPTVCVLEVIVWLLL